MSETKKMVYVTAGQMRELDRTTIEDFRIPAGRLMENAGKAVAREVMKHRKKGEVLVFAGYGNNGGDGLAAARHLINNGYSISLFFVGKPRSLSSETNANLEALLALGIKPHFISDEKEIPSVFSNIGKPAVIIDAIFGTGIRGRLDDFYIMLIETINRIGSMIISIDIPSGLDADTGEALGKAVKAETTVTLGYPKLGFKNPQASPYIGKLVIADIGLRAGPVPSRESPGAGVEKMIRLKKGRQGVVRPGHPWIYKGQFSKPDSSVRAGDIVTILAADGRFIGRAYYNPVSRISIRMLSFVDEPIDENFLENRIKAAFKKREHLSNITNACRVVFSEADGLPGLIVDLYRDTAVFQILTLGMERLKKAVVESTRNILRPKYIYEKSDSPFRKLEGLEALKKWWGEEGESVIEIFEGDAKFLVDIANGHKTGFYLDQRKSRLALAGLCRGKKVLDLFCYTGAFSVTAAVSGAASVRGVDIKEDWLEMARKNAYLNGVGERTEFVKRDAFMALKDILASGEAFDIVIIDPPSFLRKRESIKSASRGYRELNVSAMKILTEGGVLASFSCSHNMPNDIFSGVLKEAARQAGRRFTILKRCHQAEDHPIVKAIPETEYLKGYFLKVSNL